MKVQTIFILILIICFGCKINNEKENNNSLEKANYDSVYENVEIDTLIVASYTSDNNHKITLRKDNWGGLYRIEIITSQGKPKSFKVAESKYLASHTSILWDNEDFLYVYYGCGTECWGGQLLPLNNNDPVRFFREFVFSDSTSNIVVYPDSVDWMKLNIENVKSGRKLTQKLNLCNEATLPVQMIDSVFINKNNEMVFVFKGKDCESTEKKYINIGVL